MQCHFLLSLSLNVYIKRKIDKGLPGDYGRLPCPLRRAQSQALTVLNEKGVMAYA